MRLIRFSAHLVAGRRFWIAPLLVLVWPPIQAVRLVIGMEDRSYGPESAQAMLIGVPLTLLAIGFGVRIIASEIDRRTPVVT